MTTVNVGSILIANVADWEKDMYEYIGTVTTATATSIVIPNGPSIDGALNNYLVRAKRAIGNYINEVTSWSRITNYVGSTKVATISSWANFEYQPGPASTPQTGDLYEVSLPFTNTTNGRYSMQRRHQWQKDGVDIPDAIGLVHTPETPGSYRVKETAYFLRKGGAGENWYMPQPSSVTYSDPYTVVGARDPNLVYQDDLNYLGAFYAPEGNFNTQYGFSYGGNALGFNPAGNGGAGSLILGTHQAAHSNYFGEISIPPQNTWAKTDTDAIPSATLLSGGGSNLTDLLEGQWGDYGGEGSGLWTGVYSAVKGALIVGDKLVLTAFVSYGANPACVFWRRPLNFTTTGQVEGPFIVADTLSDGGIYSYPRLYSGSMIPVPADMQTKIGSTYLCGMFGDSGADYTSEGPAFAQFFPERFDGKAAVRGFFGAGSAANTAVLDANANGANGAYVGWYLVQTRLSGDPALTSTPQYAKKITGWTAATKTATFTDPWLTTDGYSLPAAGLRYVLIPPVEAKALSMYPGERWSMNRVKQGWLTTGSNPRPDNVVGMSIGPDSTNPQIWSWMTRRQGGYVFPNGTRSVLSIQLGGNGYYGYGIVNQSWGASEGIPWYWAGGADQARGEGQYPYTTRVYAYDANELEQVRLGNKKAYEALPYAVFTIKPPFRNGGEYENSKPQSATYDPATRRIYLTYIAGQFGRPVVHVYEVTNAVVQ
jgi:hypothetical protein